MKKSERLDKLFNHMDKLNISDKMRQLFIDAGMNRCDLYELRKRNVNAYYVWKKYYHRNNRLAAFMTHIVLNT